MPVQLLFLTNTLFFGEARNTSLLTANSYGPATATYADIVRPELVEGVF